MFVVRICMGGRDPGEGPVPLPIVTADTTDGVVTVSPCTGATMMFRNWSVAAVFVVVSQVRGKEDRRRGVCWRRCGSISITVFGVHAHKVGG